MICVRHKIFNHSQEGDGGRLVFSHRSHVPPYLLFQAACLWTRVTAHVVEQSSPEKQQIPTSTSSLLLKVTQCWTLCLFGKRQRHCRADV